MRYARTSFSIAAMLSAVTLLSACAKGEKAETPDSAAAAESGVSVFSPPAQAARVVTAMINAATLKEVRA